MVHARGLLPRPPFKTREAAQLPERLSDKANSLGLHPSISKGQANVRALKRALRACAVPDKLLLPARCATSFTSSSASPPASWAHPVIRVPVVVARAKAGQVRLDGRALERVPRRRIAQGEEAEGGTGAASQAGAEVLRDTVPASTPVRRMPRWTRASRSMATPRRLEAEAR